MLDVQVFNTPEVFETLHGEWNELLENAHENRIFLTWEWQSTWWRVYHPGELLVVTIRSIDGQLMGIASWFIGGDEQLHTIGCEDVTDYLDILAHRNCEADVYTALAQHLQQSGYALSLCNIPAKSPTLQFFPDRLEENGYQVVVEQQNVCPVIELPDTFEDYLNQLNKKQRHEIRRKIRRAANSEWYMVGPEHDLEAELQKFLKLMRSASDDKAKFLEDEQNLAFFKEIMPLMNANGWLQLSFITINDEPAAAYLNFVYNNEVLVYNSGLDIETSGNISAGIVLLARLVEYAIEHNYNRFDLLRGDEEYKYRMGGEDTEIFRLSAAARNQS